jgi:hypothetical protein
MRWWPWRRRLPEPGQEIPFDELPQEWQEFLAGPAAIFREKFRLDDNSKIKVNLPPVVVRTGKGQVTILGPATIDHDIAWAEPPDDD